MSLNQYAAARLATAVSITTAIAIVGTVVFSPGSLTPKREVAATGTDALDNRINELWEAWAARSDADGLADFHGLTTLAMREMIEGGDVFLRRRIRRTEDKLPVPLQLQGPYGGPLPEYWISREDLGLKPGQKNPAQPADETGSHGWNAVPLLWLHDSVLGVRIVEPGGSKLRIAPEDGGLPYVAGHTFTPKGIVWVHWDPQQWRLEVAIPRGVTAEVAMPQACEHKRVEVIASRGDVRRGDDGTFTIGSSGAYMFQVK